MFVVEQKMIKKSGKAILLAIIMTMYAPICAQAAITQNDVKIATRILTFVAGGTKGNVKVVAVTDGGTSQADAQQFVALANGMTEAGVTIQATLISPQELATSNARMIFIPQGVDQLLEQLFATASQMQMLSVTNAENYVNNKKSVVFIRSQPKVDIIISQSAANASNVTFIPILNMMAKKVP